MTEFNDRRTKELYGEGHNHRFQWHPSKFWFEGIENNCPTCLAHQEKTRKEQEGKDPFGDFK